MSKWESLDDIKGKTVDRAFRYAEGVIEFSFEGEGRIHIMLDIQTDGDPLVTHFLNEPTDSND